MDEREATQRPILVEDFGGFGADAGCDTVRDRPGSTSHGPMLRPEGSATDRIRLRGGALWKELAMSVTAYVLIQTEVGKAANVASQVSAIDGVVSAEDVTGPYDVIVRAEAPSVDDLGRMVVSHIQLIEGITRTVTCPVVNL